MVQVRGLFFPSGSSFHLNLTAPLLSEVLPFCFSRPAGPCDGSGESPEDRSPTTLTDGEAEASGAPGVPAACLCGTPSTLGAWSSGLPGGHWTVLERRAEEAELSGPEMGKEVCICSLVAAKTVYLQVCVFQGSRDQQRKNALVKTFP